MASEQYNDKKLNIDKEAREFFEHNPQDKKIHFVMVMDHEIETMEDEGIGYILETVENEEAEEQPSNTRSMEGKELFEYLMERFNYTEEQAIKSMRDHNQDVSFYEGVK